MPAKPWTTLEQTEFLESKLSDYLQSQADRRLSVFHSTVSYEFFARWPERDIHFPPLPGATVRMLTPGEQLQLTSFIGRRRSQIISWFSWHSRPHNRKTLVTSGFVKILQGNAKTRMMQPVEVYSSLYYATKIKPAVLEARGDRQLSRAENLSLIKATTQSMFMGETAKVKAEVAERFQKLKQVREQEKVGAEVGSPTYGPQDYQRAIDSFVPTFTPILEAASREMGHALMLLWAGPEPIAGGMINVRSMHAGTTEAGNNFANRHPAFEESFLKPFHAYARQIFPAEVRAHRALQPDAIAVDANQLEVIDDGESASRQENEEEHLDDSPDGIIESDCTRLVASNGLPTSSALSPSLAVGSTPSSPSTVVVPDDDSVSPRPSSVDQIPMKLPSFASSELNMSVIQAALLPSNSRTNLASVVHTPRQLRSEPRRATLSLISPSLSPSSSSDFNPDFYPPPPFMLSPPQNAPPWMIDALVHLQEISLDSYWKSCVEAWVKFEQAMEYGTLSATKRLHGDSLGRPKEFTWWTKRGRKYMVLPPIDDVAEFSRSFNVWWRSMRDGCNGDWGVLQTGGLNGFLVVMLLLRWWGHKVASTSHDWKAAVSEATACLNNMSNGKRPTTSLSTSTRKSTRIRTN